jgi:predicted RNase H-like HicB family nuclease
MDFYLKAAEAILDEPYVRYYIPEEEGGYSAGVLEFPGCYAQGETLEETVKNLEEAAYWWVVVGLEQGQTMPPANPDIVREIHKAQRKHWTDAKRA